MIAHPDATPACPDDFGHVTGRETFAPRVEMLFIKCLASCGIQGVRLSKIRTDTAAHRALLLTFVFPAAHRPNVLWDLSLIRWADSFINCCFGGILE